MVKTAYELALERIANDDYLTINSETYSITEINNLFDDLWKLSQEKLIHDIKTPYFTIEDSSDAVNKLNKQFFQQLITVHNLPLSYNFLIKDSVVLGGICYPINLINKSKQFIKYTLLHEQAHEYLKRSYLAYSVSSCLKSPVFYWINEFMAHKIGQELSDTSMEDYFTPLTEFSKQFINTGNTLEEDLESTIDQQKEFNNAVNDLNIYDFDSIIDVFLSLYPDSKNDFDKSHYDDLLNSSLDIVMRIRDGNLIINNSVQKQ